jgi:nicotinamide riboside transporter PnuC
MITPSLLWESCLHAKKWLPYIIVVILHCLFFIPLILGEEKGKKSFFDAVIMQAIRGDLLAFFISLLLLIMIVACLSVPCSVIYYNDLAQKQKEEEQRQTNKNK